jgi:hypothetical protein
MTRGVRRFLVGSVVLVALIGVAGCSHYLLAEREPWRRDAEVACLNTGVEQEAPGRVRVSAIDGPGTCGMDYPLKVSELGASTRLSTPLGYTDAPMLPPSSIPSPYPPPLAAEGTAPQQSPAIQSSTLPPPSAPPQNTAPPYGAPPYGGQQYGPPPYGQPQYGSTQYGSQPYGSPRYGSPQYGPPQYGPPQAAAPQAGAPMSLTPPGVPQPNEGDINSPGGPPHPYYNAPSATPADSSGGYYSPRPVSAAPLNSEPVPPLGPPEPPITTASAGPVEVKPTATLACPLVSALDKWISAAVQPAALKWFHQPVVEIKQISAYSCRGMNGDPNAHISEHAFGNALDIAEFDLADGHKVSVQYGWHGTPEEQGFLHDVQAAACQDFTTVLAPGANVYHYNHIHVDLMRRAGRPYICEPAAIPGDVAAARARGSYAAQHYGDPRVTGSIKSHLHGEPLGYSGMDDDRLPPAVPGDD